MSKSMPSVLVVGGGVAGMTAAKTLDAFGVSVHLIEKKGHLGGKASDWACMATSVCQNCGACLSAELAEQVKRLKHTTVHLNSNIAEIRKNDEEFETKLTGNSSEPIQTDAVLLATGLTLFNPSAIPDLGYGVYDQVITTADLNTVLKQERLRQILPDTPSPEIAFIQCVGSRNREQGRDYCSQVCCKVAVRHANRILHDIPEAAVTMFHIDLQVIGKAFRSQVADMTSRVNLLQGVPGKVLSNLKEGKLSLIHEDAETGARTAHHFDLIVLSVGIQPSSEIRDIANQLDIKTDKWGFFSNTGVVGSSLRLEPTCLAKGIYAAGVAQGPTDILTAESHGRIAAQRIIRELGSSQRLEPTTSQRLEPTTSQRLEPTELSAKKAETPIVVIGGSESSFMTARSLADENWQVTLLGTREPCTPEQKGMTCFSQAQLRSVSGVVGQYDLLFDAGGENHHVKAGAIVVAEEVEKVSDSGTRKPCTPLAEFVKKFEMGSSQRLEPTESVPQTTAFWLDYHGAEWKDHARTCLELSIALVEKGKKAIVIMEKMLVHGTEGQQFYDKARGLGVKFLRVADSKRVAVRSENNQIHLEINEATLPGIQLDVACDLLVMPEKIESSELANQLAVLLRQKKDIEGFLQSANVRHRPVGSPRRGIFFVGSCHNETDAADTKREINAVNASLEQLLLVQVSNLNQQEQASAVNEDQCIRCLTCYRICPHAAVMIRNHYQPFIIPEACFGCGICVAHCPAKAIVQAPSSEGEGVQGSLAQKTIVFACERSAGLAAKAAEEMGFALDNNTKIISVPCAGQINEIALLQPLLDGANQVIVAGCHEGNCRSMNGSTFAGAISEQMVSDIEMLEGKLRHHNIAANEPIKIARLLSMTGSDKEVS